MGNISSPFLLLISILLSEATFASSVNWFEPFNFSDPVSNQAVIVLLGQAAPGASVSVDPGQIVSTNAIVEPESGVNQRPFTSIADSEGYFRLKIEVSAGLVQVPITFASDSERITFVIAIQADTDKVQLHAPVQTDSPTILAWREKLNQQYQNRYGLAAEMTSKAKGFWFSTSGGVNYQRVEQSLDDTADINFSNFNAPSLHLKGSYSLDKWLYNADLRYTQGKVGNVSEPLTLENNVYSWNTAGLEVGRNIRIEGWKDRLRMTFLLGLQQQQVPHFKVEFGNVLRIKTGQLTTASFGPSALLELKKNVLLEIFTRYQHSISTSILDPSGIKASPNFAFDGSIGILWEIRAKRYLAAYLSGQWHSYSFKYTTGLDETSFTGNQNLFYSDLRVGYVWHL